ncbi:hypothetical protein Tco_0591533 [Tanacetum coccineum]
MGNSNASSSGTLPSNTITNPKGVKLEPLTTRKRNFLTQPGATIPPLFMMRMTLTDEGNRVPISFSEPSSAQVVILHHQKNLTKETIRSCPYPSKGRAMKRKGEKDKKNDESILKGEVHKETLKSNLNPLFEKDEEIISIEASRQISSKVDVKTIVSFFSQIGNCVRKWATNEFVKDNDEINHEVFKSDNERKFWSS